MNGVQNGNKPIFLLLMISVLMVCINCRQEKEGIENVTIYYLPPFTNVITPVSCDYFDKDFSYLKKKVTFSDTSILNNFEKHLINLTISDSSYIIDIRIKCLIKKHNQKMDTICFGEYFGIIYNGILMNNDSSFLNFIKKEIHYNE